MTPLKTTLLFDFDGTLAETMMLIMNVFNQLAPVYRYRPIPEENLEEYRQLSVHEFVEKVEIAYWKIPLIAIHARRLMHQEMDEIRPPKGLVDVLTKIHESGRYHMDILTSNRPKNVHKFLKEHAIDWFDEVHSTRSILSKKKRVEKYIRQKQLDPKSLYYIGDTSVDVESAHLAGSKVVGVTWGLNTEQVLARSNPDHLIHQPEQLLEIFPCD